MKKKNMFLRPLRRLSDTADEYVVDPRKVWDVRGVDDASPEELAFVEALGSAVTASKERMIVGLVWLAGNYLCSVGRPILDTPVADLGRWVLEQRWVSDSVQDWWHIILRWRDRGAGDRDEAAVAELGMWFYDNCIAARVRFYMGGRNYDHDLRKILTDPGLKAGSRKIDPAFFGDPGEFGKS